MKKRTKWILGGLVGVLLIGWLGIQLFTFRQPIYNNPPVAQEPKWDSPETRKASEIQTLKISQVAINTV